MNVLKYILCPVLFVFMTVALVSGIRNGSGADLLKSVGYLAIFLTCLPQVTTAAPTSRIAILIKQYAMQLGLLGFMCLLLSVAWKSGWV